MNHDRGFTMVELLVVISIMTLITASVGGALFLGFRMSTNTYSRLDQSNAALAVTHSLSGDLYAAEGPVIVNSTSDTTCGGVAPLKMWSRSQAANNTRDTLVVWVRSGTDLVRRTCVNGVQTASTIVATGIGAFTPSTCAAPCTATAITVSFSANGVGTIPKQTWSLTVQRRGATS
jgi:prepilin-type N-terminal cleavage/methylation domain-containing protein